MSGPSSALNSYTPDEKRPLMNISKRNPIATLACVAVLTLATPAGAASGPNVERAEPVLTVPASVRVHAIADYSVGTRRHFALLEEVSHNGHAQRFIASIDIARIAPATGQIVLSTPGQKNATMTAPMSAQGLLATNQPDIANAFNGALSVVHSLPQNIKVGQQFPMTFRFTARQYPEVTIAMRVIVKFADAEMVQLVGDGQVPGSATLSGETQTVILRGHCDIQIRRGVLEHSAWSLSSATMREDKPPDTISWSLYAPGERIPGSGQSTI